MLRCDALKFEMNGAKENEEDEKKHADRKIKPSISMSSFILFRCNEARSIAMAICAKICCMHFPISYIPFGCVT